MKLFQRKYWPQLIAGMLAAPIIYILLLGVLLIADAYEHMEAINATYQ